MTRLAPIALAALYAVLVCAMLPRSASASEDVYNRAWCEAMGGDAEVRQADRSRVDCLLPEYAVEADWAPKWFEGLGQAAHYARMTGRKPGLLLIIGKPRDCWRIEQARASLARVWVMVAGSLHRVRVWLTGPAVCDE